MNENNARIISNELWPDKTCDCNEGYGFNCDRCGGTGIPKLTNNEIRLLFEKENQMPIDIQFYEADDHYFCDIPHESGGGVVNDRSKEMTAKYKAFKDNYHGRK